MTPSILLISQRGNQECRCLAAEVKTSAIGKRSTSRKKMASIISGSRRTCQMRLRPSGRRVADQRRACQKLSRAKRSPLCDAASKAPGMSEPR